MNFVGGCSKGIADIDANSWPCNPKAIESKGYKF